ncbi:DNA mismatch repair endonuclease MutL [Butyrivibrio sp. INlla16]|uniref:DNA mismatch repair endonuclease MutL n=1 Tax=Butyrivibrio sp. INlla16 TaxID=1520807 RepID=UPI000891DFF3|nr:DNA mismatch repair endonuclease MutL [Butyrivibrio sp. INlla16]SDB30612.1 DNA mismatch repair protein MutL [Butyrivibrio sp. INlla16]
MAKIFELDQNTIDQIAAGEVVERPSSVVKELVENAIDSGATSITVEIHDGGTKMIRVTDNGCGIDKSEIRNAFKRHATSKLMSIDDIYRLKSLGFRGEALSSIAAVSQTELITKTENELIGTRYCVSGGNEESIEEIGAPTGTTIIVRDLFFNTPARKKFLKTNQTEGSYVGDLMEHLAMDNPSISFHFINNRDDRFTTSGNGDLKEIIYRIFGRDVAMCLVPISVTEGDYTIEGYLGEPALNRSNRNFENFFVNGRYIKDKIISKALEEGYKEYLMQHKFPFCVVHIRMRSELVDVNVHPSKMEVRFSNQPAVYEFIRKSVAVTLHEHEMIPEVLRDEREEKASEAKAAAAPVPDKNISEKKAVEEKVPEPFEQSRLSEDKKLKEDEPVFAEGISPEPVVIEDNMKSPVWTRVFGDHTPPKSEEDSKAAGPIIKSSDAVIVEKGIQLDLFDEKILTKDNRNEYTILGQIFDTYWIIAFKDKMFIVDQHAAHEKVNYERMIKRYEKKETVSQLVQPPIIVSLTTQEIDVFEKYHSSFEKLGFNIEPFGGHDYAIREVPVDIYGCENEKEMFTEILDELATDNNLDRTPDVINYKIASMACKASVKGNMKISRMEMEKLIDELLTLDNPYNCPHGRPTIISMSKYEIEKKFKRVVD